MSSSPVPPAWGPHRKRTLGNALQERCRSLTPMGVIEAPQVKLKRGLSSTKEEPTSLLTTSPYYRPGDSPTSFSQGGRLKAGGELRRNKPAYRWVTPPVPGAGVQRLQQEGALPLRAGGARGRRAERAHAPPLSLRPLPAVPSDQPDQGQVDAAVGLRSWGGGLSKRPFEKTEPHLESAPPRFLKQSPRIYGKQASAFGMWRRDIEHIERHEWAIDTRKRMLPWHWEACTTIGGAMED